MKQTQIEWTDSTVNFWIGCRKVSPGCKFCYMHRDMHRYGKDPGVIKRTADNTFLQALKWKEPRLIFTCSWSDFFIEEADYWRKLAWKVIRNTPHHKWQILTKRPERIKECLPPDWGSGYENVWLGTSIESQEYIHRADVLSQVPAKTRFISAEPLLGELDLISGKVGQVILNKFHWCIIGGESGNNSGKYRFRECQLSWIEKILRDLKGSALKLFVKQLGTHLAREMKLSDKKGGNWNEWPSHLRVREFPINKL